MNHRTRIELSDTGMSAVLKMAEGNPGAIVAIAELMRNEHRIDPDNFMTPSGLAYLMALDSHGIYSEKIYILHRYVCGENVVYMIALLRAVQLGIVSEAQLHDAIKLEIYDESGLNKVLAAVRERLPDFAKDE